ncbi:hypothetical protein CHUAL_011427 [Chamberlinius hualienensis]
MAGEFGDVDVAVSKIARDVQIRKYGKFLEEYAVQLQGIEDALYECTSDAWDMTLDPISLKISRERTTLLQLISTENKLLNKIITVLASLCLEMKQLIHEAETKYYHGLILYGEGNIETNGGTQEGETQIQTGRIVLFLQELFCFVARCNLVIKNVMQQLSSLHQPAKSSQKVIDVSGVHFLPVYETIGELLTVLVTLDEIVASQSMLKDHWELYKRLIKAVRPNPAKFAVSVNDLQPFEKLLNRMQDYLLEGRIFQSCMEQNYDDGEIIVSKNSALLEEFGCCVNQLFSNVDAKIGGATETSERHQLVGVFCLYVLNYYIFRVVDKKSFKVFWDIYKKVPAVHLNGNVLWCPDMFLLSKLPQLTKNLDKKVQLAAITSRQNFLQLKGQSLPKDAIAYYLQVTQWMVKMESAVIEKKKLEDEFDKHCRLYSQGLSLAYSIRHTVTTVMNLHVVHHKAMTKAAVLALCRLVELLKTIEYTFHRHTMLISEYISHIIQHLSYMQLKIFHSAKNRLYQEKKHIEQRLDTISALELAECTINGPGTKERRLIASLAFRFLASNRCLREEELNNISAGLSLLDTICDLHEKVRNACNCSFLYWHRVAIPIYLTDILENSLNARRMQYMFLALKDCIYPLITTKHAEDSKTLITLFKGEMLAVLKEHLLDPLCRAIETDLRLHIHSHLQLDDRNPFNVGVKYYAPFLKLNSIRFFDTSINMRAYVERYLEKTFYNLTTVALHDWHTYGEMRNLAYQKYGLIIVDDHLPSQTLEQGLDVLEIMRNINVFVVKYLYNLNNQIFVEKASNNKHLNTINIRHIANSVRTHGSGIMNTTVNFTYQFLRKKFYIFSQFMFDEHIKSRLIKDIRYFKEIKAQNDQKYPFERAEKFNRGIRKLGLTPDGRSYLDQFRQLITHIGNAMGYVRMIRSGGLHCCYNAVRFVPDLEDIVTFEDLCKEEDLSQQCQDSARSLDASIGNLIKSFEGTEYFKLLVSVFAPVFRDSKNMHLRNFHVIVPPLTVNFVEHSIACKDSLNRKNKEDAAFTDDGFAMGVAYILKLLDLDKEFDSLHWTQSVREKYRRDQDQLRKQQDSVNGKDDEKLQQTMTLTARRLETYKNEFELLLYSLSSARIFFRSSGQTVSDDEVIGDFHVILSL